MHSGRSVMSEPPTLADPITYYRKVDPVGYKIKRHCTDPVTGEKTVKDLYEFIDTPANREEWEGTAWEEVQRVWDELHKQLTTRDYRIYAVYEMEVNNHGWPDTD